jgi:HAMP domain-containing protein
MKNLSIRTRILAGVVIVNLLGALVVMVYLHESYARSVEVATGEIGYQGRQAWEQIKPGDLEADPMVEPQVIQQTLEGMKDVTGADYGYLLDKSATDQEAYEEARLELGKASNWTERDRYALLAATDDAVAERLRFEVPPADVPETGKTVGVENGACSETCHSSITGEGEYWGVAWSDDSESRAHAVFPVSGPDGQPVGVIYAVENISAQADAARASMMRTLLVIGITLLIATVAIGWMIDAWVFRRLRRTTDAIQDISVRVAGGDYDAHFEPDGTSDEIGSFEQFFAKLMDLMSSTLKSLTEQKKGNGS